MTKPKELKVRIIKPERIVTPQCSVIVPPPSHSEIWRRERYKKLRPNFDPDKCQLESSYEIKGKCYCTRHASIIALEMWITGELVEKPKDKTNVRTSKK